MLKNRLVAIGIISITGLLIACTTNPIDGYIGYQPSTPPVRNVTQFTNALQCFDGMLAKAQLKPVYITAEGIPNQAGGETAITSGRNMLITTIKQLHSNVFRFLDLPTDSNSQDASLELQGIHKSSPFTLELYKQQYAAWNNGRLTKEITYPDFTITGGITQSDKNIIANGIGANIVLENADFGVSKDDMVSVITMDMGVHDNTNFEVLFSVANSIAVYRQGTSGDLGGRIKKVGTYFNFSFDKSEGTHQAIRTLMQLNTIEILGKLANVPYQQCLSKDNELPEIFATPQPQAMAVNIVTRENDLFKVSDNIELNVSLSETGYPRCYYQDEESNIMMIYPNPYQQAREIPGNQTIKIAKKDSPIEIKITGRGSNEFLCMAANVDLESHLPDYLRVKPLTPIANAGSLDKILSDVKAKVQGLTFGFNKKQISVRN